MRAAMEVHFAGAAHNLESPKKSQLNSQGLSPPLCYPRCYNKVIENALLLHLVLPKGQDPCHLLAATATLHYRVVALKWALCLRIG
jgi:hypothetical protein